MYKDKSMFHLSVAFDNMHKRCKGTQYRHKKYLENGITVCDEWKSRKNFMNWSIKNGYKDGLTLDRICNTKGYSPENCRWVTMKENSYNKSTTFKVNYQGKDICLAELCDKLGLNYANMYYRIRKGGYSVEKAIAKDMVL